MGRLVNLKKRNESRGISFLENKRTLTVSFVSLLSGWLLIELGRALRAQARHSFEIREHPLMNRSDQHSRIQWIMDLLLIVQS